MPFPPTPSITPSNTCTPSITASNTPTLSPTRTVCPTTPSNTPTISITPSFTPTISITPSNTPTINITPSNTSTQTQTPSQTQTQTRTPDATPTMTPTPSTTFECLCFSSATVTVYTAGNITFNDCYGNPTIENFGPGVAQTYGDGTFCIQKDTNGGTAEYIIISYNDCCTPSITPSATPNSTPTQTPSGGDFTNCVEYEIDNTGQPTDITWSALNCITGEPIGGTVLANSIANTVCVVNGTISTTGSPIISILAIC